MKKVASIFLLCIFLFNTVGYFVAFKAVQYGVKKEIKFQIKAGLTMDDLTIITINKKDIEAVEWKENGKEMVYNNELYDIVKSTETTNAITYYCINDSKEKLLFSNLDEHISAHISADKPLKNSSSKKLVDHVIKLYFSNEQIFSFASCSASPMFSPILIFYSPFTIETSSPPPEFV